MQEPQYYRQDYGKHKLLENELPSCPLELFENWLKEAFEADLSEPTAMTLATANEEGRISSRIILLKGFNKGGFLFYTNYKSRKGKDLLSNNFGSLSFFWPELERQVRIEGKVEKVSKKESDLYHAARPRNNQISAWASEQSTPVLNRETLERQYEAVMKTYRDTDSIPRPHHWGGYRLAPDRIEFWQGRESRLHDRIEYNMDNHTGRWSYHRLNP